MFRVMGSLKMESERYRAFIQNWAVAKSSHSIGRNGRSNKTNRPAFKWGRSANTNAETNGLNPGPSPTTCGRCGRNCRNLCGDFHSHRISHSHVTTHAKTTIALAGRKINCKTKASAERSTREPDTESSPENNPTGTRNYNLTSSTEATSSTNAPLDSTGNTTSATVGTAQKHVTSVSKEVWGPGGGERFGNSYQGTRSATHTRNRNDKENNNRRLATSAS